MRPLNGRQIGIMGGTFDPIHLGHLVAAEWVREEMKLDEVIFIPTGKPSHKRNEKVTAAELRLSMVKAAIGDNPHFSASDMEIRRKGITYTYDTVLRLKEQLGENTQIYFIIGADSLMDVHGWYKSDELLQEVSFCAVTRPGFSNDQILMEKKRLEEEKGARIFMIEIPEMGMSSTMIRERVRQESSISYLLPSAVEEIILQKGLYKDEN